MSPTPITMWPELLTMNWILFALTSYKLWCAQQQSINKLKWYIYNQAWAGPEGRSELFEITLISWALLLAPESTLVRVLQRKRVSMQCVCIYYITDTHTQIHICIYIYIYIYMPEIYIYKETIHAIMELRSVAWDPGDVNGRVPVWSLKAWEPGELMVNSSLSQSLKTREYRCLSTKTIRKRTISYSVFHSIQSFMG